MCSTRSKTFLNVYLKQTHFGRGAPSELYDGVSACTHICMHVDVLGKNCDALRTLSYDSG